MLAAGTVYPVTVNWNLAPDTIHCVRSLVAAGVSPNHIIVVDNASTDGSVDDMRAALGSEVHILTISSNRGYAAGINLGARQAWTLGAEWIFALNNDTEVAPDFFRAVEQVALLVGPDSILAPLILYMQDRERIWRCGDRLIWGTLLTRSLYRDRRVTGSIPPIVPVDFVTGCGMLIPRKLFDAVGPFDESLFMYGEEVDFCWRARLAGFHFACATGARMWHKVSSSSNRDRPAAHYWRIRNQQRFYRSYARAYQLPLIIVLTMARGMWLGLGDLVAGHFDLLKPLMRGWIDGWFGHT